MYSLLIVEDEFEIRHGLCNYIPWDELGFEVTGEAENGKVALEFIQNHHVDVILCDIKMPHKSGLELAEELRTMGYTTKIVFLTGYKDFELVKTALVHGAQDYIVKPTKYQELAEVFQRLKAELDQERQHDKQPESNVDEQEHEDIIIKQIKQYTNEHFKTVQLKDLGAIVHMNPTYISAYFKKKTGIAFSDYVLSVKMEKAAAYLLDHNLKIYEISDLVGYSNPKNFSNAFKAYHGKTPREFRGG